MDGIAYLLVVAAAVMLGNNDRCARRKPDKKAHQQVDDGGSGTAYGSQRLLADKIADDDRVCGIIELLKKCPEQDREKEDEQLFPDHALCDLVGCLLLGSRSLCFHKYKPRFERIISLF